MASTLTLWVIALHVNDTPFTVKIESTETVEQLAKAICLCNPAVGSFYRTLLYKPSRLKLDQDDLASLIHAGLEDRTFEHLKVFKKVGDYFNGPLAKDELHIVITSKREGDDIVLGKRPSSSNPRETLAFTARKRRLAPSSASKLPALMNIQNSTQEDAIYNARPIELLQPPIAIWHPVFAKFRRLMALPTESLEFSHEQLDRARRFIVVSSGFYSDVSERHSLLKSYSPFARQGWLDETIELGGTVKLDGGTAVWLRSSDGQPLKAFTSLIEIKNEIGLGNADPLTQAECDYRSIHSSVQYTPLRKISCCPTFLVAIAGPWLAVSGAVFVDRLISEVLLDYTLIGPQFASSSETRLDAGIRRIAQLVNALEQCTSDLESYYRNLPLTHSENQLFNFQVQRHFCAPHFHQFTTSDQKSVTLKYIDRLAKEDTEKAVFKANMEDQSGSLTPVVVKFTPKYCRDAHALCADAGLAPKIWFCQRLDDVGGLYIVVMDYVNSCEVETIREYPGAVVALRQVVQLLHGNDLVFGDLREPNVLVTGKDEGMMLVDFDWCGREGEARYPCGINLDVDSIPWHEDVRRGGEIKKDHDKWLFKILTGEDLELYAGF